MTNFKSGKKTGHKKQLLIPQNCSSYFFTITKHITVIISGKAVTLKKHCAEEPLSVSRQNEHPLKKGM